MLTTTVIVALLGASNVLAAPVDLTAAEASNVDIRVRHLHGHGDQTEGYTRIPLKDMPYTRKHERDDDSNDDDHNNHIGIPKEKRNAVPAVGWLPPTLVPVGKGSVCTLDTCVECPDFPGCADILAESNAMDSMDQGAAPPKHLKRDDHVMGPPTGIFTGYGPECNINSCDLCPDFPGCRQKKKVQQPPRN